jgi:hypothetical protein
MVMNVPGFQGDTRVLDSQGYVTELEDTSSSNGSLTMGVWSPAMYLGRLNTFKPFNFGDTGSFGDNYLSSFYHSANSSIISLINYQIFAHTSKTNAM